MAKAKKPTVLLLSKEDAATFPQYRGLTDKQFYEKLKAAFEAKRGPSK